MYTVRNQYTFLSIVIIYNIITFIINMSMDISKVDKNDFIQPPGHLRVRCLSVSLVLRHIQQSQLILTGPDLLLCGKRKKKYGMT